MPLQELIDAGYQLSGPGDTLTATGHGTHFDFAPEGEDVETVIDLALNYAKLYEKMTTAQQYFRDNYTGWATMTAPQKDAAARQAQRGLANLIQHVRKDLATEGI